MGRLTSVAIALMFAVAPSLADEYVWLTRVDEGGQLLVPLREVFEAAGADVQWTAGTREADIALPRNTVHLQLDNGTARANDAPLALAVPPRLLHGRVYVPLRSAWQALGGTLDYRGDHVLLTHDATPTVVLMLCGSRSKSGYVAAAIPNAPLKAFAPVWEMFKAWARGDVTGVLSRMVPRLAEALRGDDSPFSDRYDQISVKLTDEEKVSDTQWRFTVEETYRAYGWRVREAWTTVYAVEVTRQGDGSWLISDISKERDVGPTPCTPGETPPGPIPEMVSGVPSAAGDARDLAAAPHTLDEIPQGPITGRINGRPFTAATVRLKMDAENTTLEISDRPVAGPTDLILDDTGIDLRFTLPPGYPGEFVIGVQDEKDFNREHAYYHYPQGYGRGPMSINPRWGCALEITEWTLHTDAGNRQVLGHAKGKVAITFADDEQSWVAGTFDCIYYKW